MKSKESIRSASRLEQARRRFEEWRASHAPFTRIPESLWRRAVRVAAECGVPRTAQALRVNYVVLKRRVDAGRPAQDRHSTKPVRPAFIELLPSQLTAAPECVLELEDSRGAKLRIQLRSVPDIATLARRFLSAES